MGYQKKSSHRNYSENFPLGSHFVYQSRGEECSCHTISHQAWPAPIIIRAANIGKIAFVIQPLLRRGRGGFPSVHLVIRETHLEWKVGDRLWQEDCGILNTSDKHSARWLICLSECHLISGLLCRLPVLGQNAVSDRPLDISIIMAT